LEFQLEFKSEFPIMRLSISKVCLEAFEHLSIIL
jgi:hypothetical protein